MDNTPLSQHISFLNKGLFDDEATEELTKLVKAVRETGKKGTLVIELNIGMFDKTTDDAVTITPSVKVKLPKAESRKNVFWSTYDGDLLRSDPDQQQLDLKQVPMTPKQPPKSIEAN